MKQNDTFEKEKGPDKKEVVTELEELIAQCKHDNLPELKGPEQKLHL